MKLKIDIGSIFMVCGAIAGVLLRNCRNCETK